jgi:hypothetical protein
MSTNGLKSLEKKGKKKKSPQYGKIAKMNQKKFHFFELVKACSSRGFVTSHLESCI